MRPRRSVRSRPRRSRQGSSDDPFLSGDLPGTLYCRPLALHITHLHASHSSALCMKLHVDSTFSWWQLNPEPIGCASASHSLQNRFRTLPRRELCLSSCPCALVGHLKRIPDIKFAQSDLLKLNESFQNA